MKYDSGNLPNTNPVKKLRELYYARKKERQQHYNKLIEVWKKKNQEIKIAKSITNSDLDV